MASSQKLVALLQSLKEASARNRLEWVESLESGSFESKIKGARIAISEEYGESGIIYFISLTDANQKAIETAFLKETDEGFELASDLYEIARQRALKVDEFIDRIISDVNDVAKEFSR